MPFDFTVLWPMTMAPEIDEIRFSYKFCRKLSRKFCKQAYPKACWIDYTDDMMIEQVTAKAKGNLLILVTDPEIVFSPSSLTALLGCAATGRAICAPVYNLTTVSHQTAAIPAQYVDMASFLELSALLAKIKNSHYHEVTELDTACISFTLTFLENIHPSTRLSQLAVEALKINGGKASVATDALVHQGFQKAFSTERHDLVRLIPPGVIRVLDVGCAMGGYGKHLKRTRPEIFLTGVEPNGKMADLARPIYDEMHTRPVEEVRFPKKFDLINCGDLLEHLVDPWKMLKQFSNMLTDGGRLVLSVPNAGHWSVVKGLLKGEFQYIPLGLLCIGHLRWFTKSSILEALRDAGFWIEIFENQQIPPTANGAAFLLKMCEGGYGDEESLKTNEFIIRAQKKTYPPDSCTRQ